MRKHGLIRARDLDAIGVSRMVLKRLVERGDLVRHARGLYAAADYEPTEHTDLALVAKRVPHATICLLSALRFHGLTTQNPFEVWIMVLRAARSPSLEGPPLRVVSASGKTLTSGIEPYTIEGVKVPITNPAKTVADCFRYRHAVGMDVAIEALRDCRRQRKATIDDIFHYAKIDRVANLMRPYMEMVA